MEEEKIIDAVETPTEIAEEIKEEEIAEEVKEEEVVE
jgi:hypothetical protein